MKKIRKLKVNIQIQQRKYGMAQVPELRLVGKWLNKLGFNEGETVIIKQQKGKLIITPDS